MRKIIDTKFNSTQDLIYSETREALDIQIKTLDGVNTKISVIIGFIGAILVFALKLDSTHSCLFVEGIILLFIALFLSLKSFEIEKYRRDPNPGALVKKYSKTSIAEVEEQLIANYVESFEANKEKLARKNKNINLTLGFLYIGLIFIALSVFV